jgi:hypothetical protein
MSPDKMVEEHEITVEYALTRGEVAGGLLRSVAQSPKYRRKILLYSFGIGVFTLLYRAALTRSVTPGDVMIAVGYGGGLDCDLRGI